MYHSYKIHNSKPIRSCTRRWYVNYMGRRQGHYTHISRIRKSITVSWTSLLLNYYMVHYMTMLLLVQSFISPDSRDRSWSPAKHDEIVQITISLFGLSFPHCVNVNQFLFIIACHIYLIPIKSGCSLLFSCQWWEC